MSKQMDRVLQAFAHTCTHAHAHAHAHAHTYTRRHTYACMHTDKATVKGKKKENARDDEGPFKSRRLAIASHVTSLLYVLYHFTTRSLLFYYT